MSQNITDVYPDEGPDALIALVALPLVFFLIVTVVTQITMLARQKDDVSDFVIALRAGE